MNRLFISYTKLLLKVKDHHVLNVRTNFLVPIIKLLCFLSITGFINLFFCQPKPYDNKGYKVKIIFIFFSMTDKLTDH